MLKVYERCTEFYRFLRALISLSDSTKNAYSPGVISRGAVRGLSIGLSGEFMVAKAAHAGY